MRYLPFIFFFILTFSLQGQRSKKKSVHTTRIDKQVILDGVLNESFWLGADLAKDFVMFNPGDGDPEKEHKTTVKIVFDNDAIYFGATLYDPNPSRIPTQETTRDNIGNADFFLISINPNNDGQNDTEFLVTSAGTQADAKVNSNGEDWSWNAVWESAIKMNADSWVVEMRIPYSALRFSNTNLQTWGLNIHRRIQNSNEQFVWNYIDKSSSLFTQFAGEIKGISNIKPPVRLSFSPYASLTNTSYDGVSDLSYSLGMDLKYGINESFTLDATLIPDFGQTAYDDVVLNLGPFEQQYSEKRSFFTEGTELFNKGDLFYSRRIGSTPSGYSDAEEQLGAKESIKNPNKVDMLNAIKISGRTKGNLGIGVFNAITEKTYASIRNLETNEVRKIVTEPFTNYNVLVLDQQFNKTSSVSLVNTNVTREGHFRDANVTGLLFNILNKKNTHFIDGSFKMSHIREDGQKTTGFYGDLSLGKSSGNHQYEIGFKKIDENYEINDLAYNRQNNYKRYYGRYTYRIFKPVGKFDKLRLNIWANVNYLNKPNTYTQSIVGVNAFAATKKRTAFGGNFNVTIGDKKDFYEPRTDDFSRYFKQKGSTETFVWLSTDYRNKFALDANIGLVTRKNSKEIGKFVSFSPRYRFTDKLQFNYNFEFNKIKNEQAWANTLDDGSIIFGNRTTKTIVNSISGAYNFSTKSAINLTFRHYWSPVVHSNQFYKLNNYGLLDRYSYTKNIDINYNIWNFDLGYTWEFAPGSQLTAIYRNSLFKSDDLAQLRFDKNIKNLFNDPMKNTFSLKFIYYLDYNKAKNYL